ncbi:MAG TPA: ABC transporter permease [Pyrinomonadaceae bacterium]|nr:ABC transporter permease [Pyrinomonadaceae bacterium]
METILQDLRHGFRMLVKSPLFTIVAILALALGIGVNTAIFSVVNVMLMRPLPFADSDQLMAIWTANAKRNNPRGTTAPPDFRAWKENKSFDQVGGYYLDDFNISATDQPERVRGGVVTANLFPLLRVTPSYGRLFTPEEEEFGRHRVVLLSYGLWQRRFGADPNVVGKPVTLNAESYTVVGVLPPDSWLRQPRQKAELWVPMAFESGSNMNTRNNYFLRVVGRLKPGVDIPTAQAEMNTISQRLEQEFKENAGLTARIEPLAQETVGDNRSTLLVLMGAVGFVLLIACANVANLLLARAAAREKETAVRIALGANRIRLVRLWLTENLWLSLIGGVLGLILAYVGLRIILALAPENLSRGAIISRGVSIPVDYRVLIFTLLLSVLTGVVFGLLPVFQASNPDLTKALKESARGSTDSIRSRRMRGLLVVSEIALALVLLIGAALMLKSFMHLQSINPGFNTDNLLTAQIALPELKYKEGDQRSAFFQRAAERIRSLPGVQAVGATTSLPMSNESWGKQFSIEGRTPPATLDQVEAVEYRQVTPDYFKATGVPLLKGRYFTDQDTKNSPGVIIINDAVARTFFPNEDPIGKRVWPGPPESMLPPQGLPPSGRFTRMTIVGVVGDVMSYGVTRPIEWEVYVPHVQGGDNIPLAKMYLSVRTNGDPLVLASAVRNEIRQIDPDQPVADIRTMDQRLNDSLWQPRFNMLLLTIFAGVAVLLAAIGIYGMVSYNVTQRTSEIGIRVALGAQRSDVLKVIMKQGLIISLIGVVIGLVAAFALTRVLSTLLVGVSSTDLTIFGVVTVLLLLITLLGSFIPARRATKIDPLIALRTE